MKTKTYTFEDFSINHVYGSGFGNSHSTLHVGDHGNGAARGIKEIVDHVYHGTRFGTSSSWRLCKVCKADERVFLAEDVMALVNERKAADEAHAAQVKADRDAAEAERERLRQESLRGHEVMEQVNLDGLRAYFNEPGRTTIDIEHVIEISAAILNARTQIARLSR